MMLQQESIDEIIKLGNLRYENKEMYNSLNQTLAALYNNKEDKVTHLNDYHKKWVPLLMKLGVIDMFHEDISSDTYTIDKHKLNCVYVMMNAHDHTVEPFDINRDGFVKLGYEREIAPNVPGFNDITIRHIVTLTVNGYAEITITLYQEFCKDHTGLRFVASNEKNKICEIELPDEPCNRNLLTASASGLYGGFDSFGEKKFVIGSSTCYSDKGTEIADPPQIALRVIMLDTGTLDVQLKYKKLIFRPLTIQKFLKEKTGLYHTVLIAAKEQLQTMVKLDV